MQTKTFLVVSSVLISISMIFMCVSVSTPHWMETKMNFTTSFMSITKSYQGLFKMCQDLEMRGNAEKKCRGYDEFAGKLQGRPAYWHAVQAFIFIHIICSSITVGFSLLLAFNLKSKAVLHVFVLSIFQVLPVCSAFLALSIFTSKKIEETEVKPSMMFQGTSFGYSYILAWCACGLSSIALFAGFVFTLFNYRSEHTELMGKFKKIGHIEL